MSAREGGPAFPVPSYVNASGETHDSSIQGMTLRDYFAAAALSSISEDVLAQESAFNPHSIAAGCYLVADAMLAEREKWNASNRSRA